MRLSGFVLLLIAFAGSASADQSQRDVEFAKTKLGRFELSARTQIRWLNDEPYVDAISCRGENGDIDFEVDQTGQLRLWFTFRGLPDDDGDREKLTLIGDRLWLHVDGAKFEFARIPVRSTRLSDYDYRPIPDDPDAVILPVWRGHSALRPNGKGVFVHFNRFHETVVRARKLEWGFISRNWQDVGDYEANALPAGWQNRRYPIDNTKLRESIAWCSTQVASDAAREFKPEKRLRTEP